MSMSYGIVPIAFPLPTASNFSTSSSGVTESGNQNTPLARSAKWQPISRRPTNHVTSCVQNSRPVEFPLHQTMRSEFGL